jgi:hypothetical protein
LHIDLQIYRQFIEHMDCMELNQTECTKSNNWKAKSMNLSHRQFIEHMDCMELNQTKCTKSNNWKAKSMNLSHLYQNELRAAWTARRATRWQGSRTAFELRSRAAIKDMGVSSTAILSRFEDGGPFQVPAEAKELRQAAACSKAWWAAAFLRCDGAMGGEKRGGGG